MSKIFENKPEDRKLAEQKATLSNHFRNFDNFPFLGTAKWKHISLKW